MKNTSFAKKAITISYITFSLGWICLGICGTVLNLFGLVENGYEYMSKHEIFTFWGLTFAYCILVVSQVFCIFKSFMICFKNHTTKYFTLEIIVNAIIVCLIPDAYTSVLWYQILGELNNQSIIYLLKPLLTSDFYCVLTMLSMCMCNKMCNIYKNRSQDET